MSDPFQTPPGTNPPRHVEQDSSGKSWLWPAGILGAVILLGALFFSVAEREDQTAGKSPPTTTGQGTPARPAPMQPAPR